MLREIQAGRVALLEETISGRLVRVVRRVRLLLRATALGDREVFLMEQNPYNNLRGTKAEPRPGEELFFAPSMKLDVRGDLFSGGYQEGGAESGSRALLLTQVRFPKDLINRHLCFESSRDQMSWRESRSCPGLRTACLTHEVVLRVRDPREPACRVMGLPFGQGFSSSELPRQEMRQDWARIAHQYVWVPEDLAAGISSLIPEKKLAAGMDEDLPLGKMSSAPP